MNDRRLFVTIVLDGVGIGEQPDSHKYGDAGSNTLAHVCAASSPHLPHLTALGLGCIHPLEGVPPVSGPIASFGRMREASSGKDSTTGHWELAGIHLDSPFPVYPDGFPEAVIDRFMQLTGINGILGNRTASGTQIVQDLGDEHIATGHPIVYTSADSVFQVAAHKDVIPLDALYEMCRLAREKVCIGEHAVGRVIARPFVGSSGAYERISAERKDFSRKPPTMTLQEALQQADVHTAAIGKIGDLFAGVGFDDIQKTKSNVDGVGATLERIAEARDRSFIWTNLVDFDQEFGHRNDPDGFARALEAFDRAVPAILPAMPPNSRLVITADHGNDPTTPSTDHSREHVPVLIVGGREGHNIGTRASFADHAATVAAFFGIDFEIDAESFLV